MSKLFYQEFNITINSKHFIFISKLLQENFGPFIKMFDKQEKGEKVVGLGGILNIF